jgi:hypothetical protein
MSSSVGLSGVALSFAANPCAEQVLEEPDMRALVRSISMKPSVASLKLQGNILSSAGSVVLLSNYLQQTTSLRSLDLSMCGLGDVHCSAIVKAACSQSPRRPSPPISFIDVSFNSLTAKGAQVIAKILRFHSGGTVKSLSVKYNPLTATGLLALLRVNNGLAELDVRYSHVLDSDGSAEQIAQGLREDRTLRSLLLDGCGLNKHQQQTLLEALHGNRKSKLTPQTLSFTKPAAGPKLLALDALVASACASADGGPARVTQELLNDIVALDGMSVVVRGRLRGAAVPDARVDRGCSKTRKAVVECLEVSHGAYERSASAQRLSCRHVDPGYVLLTAAGQSDAESEMMTSVRNLSATQQSLAEKGQRRRCERAPAIGRLVEREQQQELAFEEERAVLLDLQVAEDRPIESVVPLLRGRSASRLSHNNSGPHDLSTNRSASVGSVNSARSAMRSASEHHPPLLLSKGQTAKMLLDRAMVSDEQCAEILNVSVDVLPHLIVESDFPMALNDALPLPSQLNRLEMASESRVKGVARILWLILHFPGNRVTMKRLTAMNDLPTYIAVSAPETAAKYRSLRGVENRAAKELLGKLRLQEAPLPRPMSKSDLSKVPSRYMPAQRRGGSAASASNASQQLV